MASTKVLVVSLFFEEDYHWCSHRTKTEQETGDLQWHFYHISNVLNILLFYYQKKGKQKGRRKKSNKKPKKINPQLLKGILVLNVRKWIFTFTECSIGIIGCSWTSQNNQWKRLFSQPFGPAIQVSSISSTATHMLCLLKIKWHSCSVPPNVNPQLFMHLCLCPFWLLFSLFKNKPNYSCKEINTKSILQIITPHLLGFNPFKPWISSSTFCGDAAVN